MSRLTTSPGVFLVLIVSVLLAIQVTGGLIIGWGNPYEHADNPPPGTGFVAIAAGWARSAALYEGTPGDMNCDGSLNTLDIDLFVKAVVDPGDYATIEPDCNRLNADCNGDGVVNSLDIDVFVTIMTDR